MHIAEFDNIVYIRLMPLGIERIAQKYEQIDLILLDLRPDLLHTAEMPVVAVAYNLWRLRIPRYAIQKFCISFFFASCAINAILIALSLGLLYVQMQFSDHSLN